MKHKVVLITLIFILLGNTACTPPTQIPPSSLKIPWVLWPGWYPILIAQEQGFFQKHGVTVEPVFYEVYSDIQGDFISGKLDGGLQTIFEVLVMESQASPANAHVVMITDISEGADAILAGPAIQTVADLRGKKVGVKIGSFAEVLVRRMLEDNGLTINDVVLVDTEPENLLEDLQTAQIDAGHTYEPFISEAQNKGYHTLYSTADAPGLIANVLVFRESVLQDRPEDIRAFIAAWQEAVNWWQQHPEEGNALIARLTGQKPEDISLKGIELFNYDKNVQSFADTQSTTSLTYYTQYNLDFLRETGAITRMPDIQQLFDSSYLK